MLLGFYTFGRGDGWSSLVPGPRDAMLQAALNFLVVRPRNVEGAGMLYQLLWKAGSRTSMMMRISSFST